jgi:hypothetical protein
LASGGTRRLSREGYAQRRAEKIEAAQAVLADQVAAIQSGEDWRRYLAVQARLHTYSASNVLLIVAQHAKAIADGNVATPLPSYVAGFQTWKALGRTVQAGQRGYAILAPHPRTTRTATDADGNQRTLKRREHPRPDESVAATTVMRGFGIEYVFAAEQTQGDPLPEPPRAQLLEGDAPAGLEPALVTLADSYGYTVVRVSRDALGEAKGMTRFDAGTILIRSEMDVAAQVKTLIHEIGHVLLHDPATNPAGALIDRGLKEVEAESVAYIVADAHGMPTDAYSFPYIAGWAGDNGADAVQATATRVACAAKEIIAASPAEHDSGGKVPGADLAVAAALERRNHELGGQSVPQLATGLDSVTA